MPPRIRVTKIPNMNLIVIKQDEGSDFFLAVKDSIIISVASLSSLLKFLTENDYVNIKVLEGIIEDVRNQRGIN